MGKDMCGAGSCGGCSPCSDGDCSPKDKAAWLEMKEKMLEAKLEHIKKMKEEVSKEDK